MKDTLAVDNPGDWDTPVLTQLVKEWSHTLTEGIYQGCLSFPCSTSSIKVIKKPRLVKFWDRSSQAFTVAIYSVTMVSKFEENDQEHLPDGDINDEDFNPQLHKFQTCLIAAKA